MKAKKTSNVNLLNTLFILSTTFTGITAVVLLPIFGQIHWATWILCGCMGIVTGLSITAGYHRLCSHKSYQTRWIIRLIFSLFGAAAFQGSVAEWCTDHRKHHCETDTDNDPYNIKRGFWYAHIGWLFLLDTSKRNFDNVNDLLADPIYRFQHRYYPIVSLLMGFALPTAIAALWGNALGGFLIAGAFRIAVIYQTTFFINSICHIFGKQTYKNSSARDNWITALVTFGEGFHNFHHQFPIDYRNGVRFFHYDPTKWLIYMLYRLGLVYDLKRVQSHHMVKYRMRFDLQRLKHISHEWITPFSQRMNNLIAQLEILEKEYLSFKKVNLQEYQKKARATHRELKQIRRELKTFTIIWSKLINKMCQFHLEANARSKCSQPPQPHHA